MPVDPLTVILIIGLLGLLFEIVRSIETQTYPRQSFLRGIRRVPRSENPVEFAGTLAAYALVSAVLFWTLLNRLFMDR